MENTNKPEFLFDVDRKDFYLFRCSDEIRERTRKRLVEIAECGMEECGVAQFGYSGAMSGLYIENVWDYSDEDFKSYMDWARQLISTYKLKVGEQRYGN